MTLRCQTWKPVGELVSRKSKSVNEIKQMKIMLAIDVCYYNKACRGVSLSSISELSGSTCVSPLMLITVCSPWEAHRQAKGPGALLQVDEESAVFKSQAAHPSQQRSYPYIRSILLQLAALMIVY